MDMNEKIPKPESGTATQIGNGCFLCTDYGHPTTARYMAGEARLLLAVLKGVDAEKRAMQGDEKEVRAAHRMIDNAYMAAVNCAPHLIDAARAI